MPVLHWGASWQLTVDKLNICFKRNKKARKAGTQCLLITFLWQIVYGPSAWENVAIACRQSDQSPIDITTKDVEADSSLGELDISCDNDKGLFNGVLLNNGYEPVLTTDSTRGTCNLTGAPLDSKNFELHDLNIHFGCDTDRGSEHTVDGKPFPAEVRHSANNFAHIRINTTLDDKQNIREYKLSLKEKKNDL